MPGDERKRSFAGHVDSASCMLIVTVWMIARPQIATLLPGWGASGSGRMTLHEEHKTRRDPSWPRFTHSQLAGSCI